MSKRYLKLALQFLIFSAFVLTPLLLVAQSLSLDAPGWTFDGVSQRDSLYAGDTVRLTEIYYRDSYSEGIRNNDEPGSKSRQIWARGEDKQTEKNHWSQYGKWTYWYENGAKHLETNNPLDSLSTRYVNQWLLDGTQILREGVGHYYEMEYSGTGTDSVVYEIRGGLKHGSCKIWGSRGDGLGRYLSEIGHCSHNKQEGPKVSYYESGVVKSVHNYSESWLNGSYMLFHENGLLAESGERVRLNRSGVRKFWNEAGQLVKSSNYSNGTLKGKYEEYHANGQVALSGVYIHTTGGDTTYIENLNTGEFEPRYVILDNIPAKHGKWVVYDDTGKVIQVQVYRAGVLVEE